jgi:hypothetical protein
MGDGVRIQVADVQAWLEPTKSDIVNVDPALDLQIETQTLAQLEAGFDVSGWLSPGNTPVIVKSVLAMLYAAATLDRQNSEDNENTDAYAAKLEAQASMLIDGMLNGTVVVDGYLVSSDPHSSPESYPNDSSSGYGQSQVRINGDNYWGSGDPSVGPPKFSMNLQF